MARQEPVGAMLQHWRKTRHLSQLGLATQASVSSRHLCFVETGRAQPSREMVLRLARALDVPLRERNALLLAAGFAPVFSESKLDAPALEAVRGALDAILKQQEPYPAVVMNRQWDILRTNDAATRFFGFLLGSVRNTKNKKVPAVAAAAAAAPNVLRMMFDPNAVKPYVSNWNDVSRSLIDRVRREAVGGTPDPATQKLLAEVLAYEPSDVLGDGAASASAASAPLVPVVPVLFEKGGEKFHFFSAITTLGTPQDITVQEIRIECFFPVDHATAKAARRLAAARRLSIRRKQAAQS